jgi:hypothetical protein
MMGRLFAPLAVAGAMLVASSASAQPAAPTQVRGQVVSLEGATLTVKQASGPVAITMDGTWTINVLKNIDVNDIKPGSFIGTTNVDKPDGSGTSTEIHVFPPGVRLGEGHYPWRGGAGSMMTNGDVTMTVASTKGREMDIKYNGQGGQGVRHVVVPPGTPIVTFSPGAQSMLKPGWNVLIFATTGPDGKLHANGVTTGENGVAPPM